MSPAIGDTLAAVPPPPPPSQGAASPIPTTERAKRLRLDVGAILDGSVEPAVAINGQLQVVAGNRAAAQLLGLRIEQLIGRPCHELLSCQDAAGHALCSSDCPLTVGTAGRQWPADFLIHGVAERTATASGTLVALPAGTEPRGLLFLQAPLPVDGAGSSGQGAFGSDLPLEKMLHQLLELTRADAGEIFLLAPSGRETVMVAQAGSAARAFRQRVHFELGQGFPGVLAQSSQDMVSLDLTNDPRFLRSAVKQLGFQSYLGVPLVGSTGVLGSLHLAARRRPRALLAQRRLIAQAAHKLAQRLETARFQAAKEITEWPWDSAVDAAQNLTNVAAHALAVIVQLAGVEKGELYLCDERARTLALLDEHVASPTSTRAAKAHCAGNRCPAVERGECVLSSDSPGGGRAGCRPSNALCLPLVVGQQPIGVIRLERDRREALPARHLVSVHGAIAGASAAIYNARLALRQQQLARYSAVPVEAPRGLPESSARPALARTAVPPERREPFIEFHCLGQFMLREGGQPVLAGRFARRRSLNILKILLTRYGKAVHRDELMEILWPEEDPDRVGRLLNVAVHYLRHGLEPELGQPQASRFIRTDGEWYSFDLSSPHALDTQEFMQAVRLARAAEHKGELRGAADAYERAMAIYRGDFLEEERYSDWCALEREQLREQLLASLKSLGIISRRLGQLDRAVSCFRRALVLLPLSEDIHRELMSLFWQSGQRDQALRQYRACEAILQRECGVGPLPETRALHDAIMAG